MTVTAAATSNVPASTSQKNGNNRIGTRENGLRATSYLSKFPRPGPSIVGLFEAERRPGQLGLHISCTRKTRIPSTEHVHCSTCTCATYYLLPTQAFSSASVHILQLFLGWQFSYAPLSKLADGTLARGFPPGTSRSKAHWAGFWGRNAASHPGSFTRKRTGLRKRPIRRIKYGLYWLTHPLPVDILYYLCTRISYHVPISPISTDHQIPWR